MIDSNLTKRWVDVTNENQNRKDKFLTFTLTNTTYKNIDRVRQQLTDCINRINKVYDDPLPLYSDVEELDETHLNYLHEQFEKYGERILEISINEEFNWSREMHEDFLQLNEIIHLYEDVIKSKKAHFPNMALLYDYYPQEIHCPILETDKIWLTSQLKWGEVYLGYNTLGKDWLKVHVDNDIEVIERNQIKPQDRFAAETWINFGPDLNNWWSLLSFERWVNGLPKDLQSKVPLNNLNKLCLGRYRIGHIIIDDEFLNKYGGTLQDYQIDDSEAKLKWNMNVFSTFVKIERVELL
jgi:hypothetical protein